MAARPTKEIELAQRNYRKLTAQQKLEILLAGLRVRAGLLIWAISREDGH